MPQSEIAQLRQRIEVEYIAALRGLSGLSEGTARHEVITQKMEHVWDQFQRLVESVGPAEAHRLAFGEPLPERCEVG